MAEGRHCPTCKGSLNIAPGITQQSCTCEVPREDFVSVHLVLPTLFSAPLCGVKHQSPCLAILCQDGMASLAYKNPYPLLEASMLHFRLCWRYYTPHPQSNSSKFVSG